MLIANDEIYKLHKMYLKDKHVLITGKLTVLSKQIVSLKYVILISYQYKIY